MDVSFHKQLTDIQAWHQDRLDLAKLMLVQAKLNVANLTPATAEQFADTFYEIGKSESQRMHWAEASEWLEKAEEWIEGSFLDKLNNDTEELRLGIMHARARALIALSDGDSREKAGALVKNMDSEYGDRLIVLLLKLDLLVADPEMSPQDYCDVLHRIIRTIHLTDTNLMVILHHVRELRIRSPQLAHNILAFLLEERLLGAGQHSWTEKILVITVWNCTSADQFPNVLGSLQILFDTILVHTKQPVHSKATHAAQTVSPPLHLKVEADIHSSCGNA